MVLVMAGVRLGTAQKTVKIKRTAFEEMTSDVTGIILSDDDPAAYIVYLDIPVILNGRRRQVVKVAPEHIEEIQTS